MHNLFALALLATAVTALPSKGKDGPSDDSSSNSGSNSGSGSGKCKASLTATFDDLNGLPLVETNTIPTGYKGLYFQGFKYLEIVPTNILPGVFPHSGNNYAFSNVVTTTTGGSAEWTASYPGSTIQSFTPSSFYYGCALDLGQGAAGTPTACNIAITGYKRSDDNASGTKQIAAQTFTYTPSTIVGVTQMAKGTFNGDFKEVQYVSVQYTVPGGLAAVNTDLTVLIDDIVYATCSSDDKGGDDD